MITRENLEKFIESNGYAEEAENHVMEYLVDVCKFALRGLEADRLAAALGNIYIHSNPGTEAGAREALDAYRTATE